MNNKTVSYTNENIIAFVILYLLGVSSGLFLYPFIGYQGIIAFSLLGLSVIMLIGAMAIRS